MIRFALSTLVSLTLFGVALAQDATAGDASSLELRTAVQRATEVDPEVLTARTELASAERSLARTQADPQALGLDLLDAQHAVAAAEDALVAATAASALETATAHTNLLEATDALARAEIELEVVATRLEATRARRAAGAATDLEVTRASNDLAAAQRARQEAEAERALACEDLRLLLGPEVDLTAEPVAPLTESDLPDVAPLDALYVEANRRNGRLRAAERAVASAEAQLAATDNAFSSRAQIEAAEERLASAEANLSAARRTLDLTLQQRYAAVTAAQNRLQNAAEGYRTSLENLEGQRARLAAGSISALAFREAELSHLTAEASLAAARHAVVLAVFRLEQAVVA